MQHQPKRIEAEGFTCCLTSEQSARRAGEQAEDSRPFFFFFYNSKNLQLTRDTAVITSWRLCSLILLQQQQWGEVSSTQQLFFGFFFFLNRASRVERRGSRHLLAEKWLVAPLIGRVKKWARATSPGTCCVQPERLWVISGERSGQQWKQWFSS